MKKTALVPIADGTEEIEAVTIIDVLRRAGADVVVASVGGREVVASRGVKIVADCLIGVCGGRPFDLVVLPGGMPGAEHLRDNETLKRILMEQSAAGRLFGAICASPAVVLEAHGLLKNRRATCHPGHIDKLSDPTSAQARVVVDGHCITSQGPGTAMEFALKLVELLFGPDKAAAVAGPMVIA
jgi:4-methyl-5(b-hydroxyethyl)-thiazole monophosphate biosynthesis